MSQSKRNMELVLEIWDALHAFASDYSPRMYIQRIDQSWLEEGGRIVREHADLNDEGNVMDVINDWIANKVDQMMTPGGSFTWSVMEDWQNPDSKFVFRMDAVDKGFSWCDQGWAVSGWYTPIGEAIEEHEKAKLARQQQARIKYAANMNNINAGTDDPSVPLVRTGQGTSQVDYNG